MKQNVYPVTFRDFLKANSVGSSHILFYCILNDRLHFELPIENANFISQKFINSLKEEVPENIMQDPIDMFLKMNFPNRTRYRYYPTEAEAFKLQNIKLYTKLVTSFSDTSDNPGEVYESEDDNKLYIFQGEDKIAEFEKV